MIRKEFTYISHKAKLRELKNRQADELNTEFTEHSINSNEDELLRNDSSKSIILCPFNSQAGANTRPLQELIKDMLEDKDVMIRFHARVREQDR